MNVEMLRKEYDKLTPFEREALLVREAVGRKRMLKWMLWDRGICLKLFG